MVRKPLDVPIVDHHTMRRVQFYMPFVGIDVEFDRPSTTFEFAIGRKPHAKFTGRRLYQQGDGFRLIRVRELTDAPELLSSRMARRIAHADIEILVALPRLLQHGFALTACAQDSG